MQKRGVSAVVATVLIIMVTIAAIGIIFGAVMPLVRNSLDSSISEDVELAIDVSQGYTVWDEEKKGISVQVRRGEDDSDLTGIQLIIDIDGKTEFSSILNPPAPNRAKTYNLPLSARPSSIKVAPVFGGKVRNSVAELMVGSSEGSVLPSGNVDPDKFWDFEDLTPCSPGLNGDNKVVICSCQDLQDMSSDLNADYILGKSVDCSGIANFVPIINFNGSFDGENNVIRNLFISRPGQANNGLFGNVSQNTEISNVGLFDVNISGGTENNGALIGLADYAIVTNSYATGFVSGGWDSGGLLGEANNIQITNSHANVVVSSTGGRVGGLIGDGSGSGTIITNSYAEGNVLGEDGGVGGLLGHGANGEIRESHSVGNIEGAVQWTGGLCGHCVGTVILESYATGDVNSTGVHAGGLVGVANNGEITNSYATGEVWTSNNYAGGLVAWMNIANITNSYATGNVRGSAIVGGLVGRIDMDRGDISIINSYATGKVRSANGNAGGLVAEAVNGPSGGEITNSYTTSDIFCNAVPITNCGGVLGNGAGFTGTFSNVKWTNYTTDSATNCIGSTGTNPSGCSSVSP